MSNISSDPAVPGWASVGQVEAWDARAITLARTLESRGVSAEQLFEFLEVVLPNVLGQRGRDHTQ